MEKTTTYPCNKSQGRFTPRSLRVKKISHPDLETPCWVIESHTPHRLTGYVRVVRDGRAISVHRLIHEKAEGPIPEGLCVLYRCDRRNCVNPLHLFRGTHLNNSADMILKGRSPCRGGEKNSRSKLIISQVQSIRDRYANGINQPALAREYGVNQSTISGIVRRETWRNI